MTGSDEIDLYRRGMAGCTPANLRREADIQASLRSFDALKAPASRFALPVWLRLRALIGASTALAAGLAAVVLLPKGNPEGTVIVTAPPELRLALPDDQPATASVDRASQVLAAFTSEAPQYFPLPWSRGSVVALLEGVTPGAEETVLFAANGRRLSIMPQGPSLLGSRAQDEDYQRFIVALVGLSLLKGGASLGVDWTQAELLTEARRAATGSTAREAALAVVVEE